MTTTHQETRSGPRRLAVMAAVVGLIAAACTGDDGDPQTGGTATADSGTSTSAPNTATSATPETDDSAPQEDDSASSGESVLVTPCFVTGPELVLPQEPEWIAADVSSGGGDCLFVLQAKDLADTTVIAGELFTSSSGRPFDEFVSQLEEELAVGQEPDILALQLLNSGPTGRDLPILERIELEEPNRAVILIHESDRRGGYNAFSAVVDVPTESDPTMTHAIKLWGLLLPPEVGEPPDSPNYQLATDLINSMQIEAQ